MDGARGLLGKENSVKNTGADEFYKAGGEGRKTNNPKSVHGAGPEGSVFSGLG